MASIAAGAIVEGLRGATRASRSWTAVGPRDRSIVVGRGVIPGRSVFRERTERICVRIGVADSKLLDVLLAFAKGFNLVLCSSRSLRCSE